jgi:hypothetical protein
VYLKLLDLGVFQDSSGGIGLHFDQSIDMYHQIVEHLARKTRKSVEGPVIEVGIFHENQGKAWKMVNRNRIILQFQKITIPLHSSNRRYDLPCSLSDLA